VPPSRRREPFAPGGHPQARERRRISGGRSTTSKKDPLVEKKEDTIRRETMINGAMSSALMG
jgi:hypothetical protein